MDEKTELNEEDRHEIARLIEDGRTGGVFVDEETGTRIEWELKVDFSEEETDCLDCSRSYGPSSPCRCNEE